MVHAQYNIPLAGLPQKPGSAIAFFHIKNIECLIKKMIWL
jgi:hypothetical protein